MAQPGERPDLTVNAEHVFGQQIGDSNTQINYYAGRPAVTWPHQVGSVPPLAEGYQPRSDTRLNLRRELGQASSEPGGHGARKAVSTQVLAGMGGIGKTQLAAAYAHEQWQAAAVDEQ